MYYTSKDCKYFGVDVDDYEFFNDGYEFFDDDYGNYDYDYDNYDYDYDDDCYYNVYDDDYYYNDDNYYDNDYDDDYLYYRKPFNNFECLVFVKNNIVNLINNDDCDIKPLLSVKNITLLVDNINISICENAY